MSWESIVSFIVILAISSLFNRFKNVTTAPRTERPPGAPRDASSPRPPVQPSRPVKRQETKGRRPASSLEQMLRELQSNMTDVFDQYAPREENAPQGNPIIEEVKAVEIKPKEPIKVKKQEINPIAKGEIGKSALGQIKFNRQSVLQGVIMSEVLGKPKSMR